MISRSAQLLIASLTLLLTFPAHSALIDPTANSKDSSNKEEAMVKGQIIVKFKDEGQSAVTEDMISAFNQRKSFKKSPQDSAASLDKLAREYKVKSTRKLFKLNTSAEISKAQKGFNKNKSRRADPAKYIEAVRRISNIAVLEIDPSADPLAACNKFKADPHVEYCQPNYTVTTFMVPNDPYYNSSGSWGQSYGDLWGLTNIQAGPAWDSAQGTDVVVAIVDTGVDYNHPDIAANIWINTDEVPGNGIDDDGNGFIDDVRGWNFVLDTSDPMDRHGHGTHCAGTVAAIGNNNLGIIGVAPKAKIMPIKGLNDSGSGTFDDLANAIIYAAQNGADVISNSWGCGTCESPAAEEAVRLADSLGSIVVFAAGNNNDDVASRSPQNMSYPKPIVVAATDQNNTKTWFSSFGNLVDVSAPGGGLNTEPNTGYRNILSLKSETCHTSLCSSGSVIGTNYLRLAGTSMATPHVAGLVALLLEKYPAYSISQIKELLYANVNPATSTVPIGYGLISAQKSVANSSTTFILAKINAPKTGAMAEEGNPVTIYGTATAKSFARYELYVGAGNSPTTWETTGITLTGGKVIDGLLGAWTTPQRGIWTIRLVVTDLSGATKESRTLVNVITARRPGWPVVLGGDHYTFDRWTGNTVSTDIDNDGKKEIIFFQYDSTFDEEAKLIVLRENGTMMPGFPVKAAVNYPPPPSSSAGPSTTTNLVVANLDNNPNDKEIAFADRFSIHAFKNDGTKLPGWPKAIQGMGSINAGLSSADVNGDGQVELFIPQLDNGVAKMFAYYKDGTLVPGWPQAMEHAFATTIASADIAGDSKPEIVALNYQINLGPAGKLYAWHSDGTLVSGFPVSYGGADFFNAIIPALGDVDGDGKADIVVRNSYPSKNIAVYDGQGQLKPGWPKPIASGRSELLLSDIDNDGAMEIIANTAILNTTTNRSDQLIDVYKGNGTMYPGWPLNISSLLPVPITSHPIFINNIVAGDINGDGNRELVVLTGYQLYNYIQNVNTQIFTFDKSANQLTDYTFILEAGNFYPSGLSLTDLDNNGTLELTGMTLTHNDLKFSVWDLPGEYNPATLDWPMDGQNPRQTSSLKLFKNTAPVLNAIPTQNVTTGQRVSVTLSGSDPDGHPVDYRAVGTLPAGATLNTGLRTDVNRDGIVNTADVTAVRASLGSSNPQHDINVDSLVDNRDVLLVEADLGRTDANPGLFQWTPSTAGSQSITFAISDGKLSDTKTMLVNVTGDPAPTPKPPAVYVRAKPTTINANETTNLVWATRNAVSCQTPWGSTQTQGSYTTPPLTQTTTYTVVCYSPGGGEGSASVTITVIPQGNLKKSTLKTQSPNQLIRR